MHILNSITSQEGTIHRHDNAEDTEAACPLVIILADDLTGACDSAAAFLSPGRSAWVWLRDRSIEAKAANVWSFSTESRNETPAVAAEKVKKLIRGLAGLPPSILFFKKVDSAGRGCFAEEIAAARALLGADLVVYSPAFPESGRFVVNGSLHIHDVTGERREIRIHDIFPQQMHTSIGLIPSGTDTLVEQSLLQAVGEGKHLLVCDAGESGDLERIVRVAGRLHRRILWAGSAGLGRELARVLPSGMFAVREAHVPIPRAPIHGKTLIFAGSSHSVTRLQMDHLSEAISKNSLPCIPIHIRFEECSEDSLQKKFQEAGAIGSLVLTGGDTAAMVLRALGADAIEIAGEMTVGIPWGIVHGGMADGCVVVTKSGGFGGENALLEAVHFCQGVTS
jgi:uncharacterized protein YgbK (DUF1537 family)